MQSYNEKQRLLQTSVLENEQDVVAAIAKAQSLGAVSHVIGKLPKHGDTVKLNGLEYRVDFADHVKGKFSVKLTLKKEK